MIEISGVYPLGEAIPPISRSISFLVLAFRVLQALPVLRVLQGLQALQAIPSPRLVSPAAPVIDYSRSTKMSQKTLKLRIPLLISS